MGFGFYGRSFQLADVSCSAPGCQFSGAGTAGPCSDASGIMYYYEIMALLKQHPELKPVWDISAGVKYVVFNSNQWISYDDADTFAIIWGLEERLSGLRTLASHSIPENI